MCSEVLFTYRCGCTEHTLFECPGSAPHQCHRRPCPGPGDCIETKLDEDCHDCSQVAKRRPFMPAGIKRWARFLDMNESLDRRWLKTPKYLSFAGHGSLPHHS